MTDKARKRAYRALLTAEAQGEGKHFPRVWTCGEHVYFSWNAAYLQQREYAAWEGLNMPIEEVTYGEACKHDPWGNEHPNWKDEVDWAIETARFNDCTGDKIRIRLRNSAIDPQQKKKSGTNPKSKVAEVIGSEVKPNKKKK